MQSYIVPPEITHMLVIDRIKYTVLQELIDLI